MTQFDAENIKNTNSAELRVTLADLGVNFIQKYEAETAPPRRLPLLAALFQPARTVVTKEHKVLWSQQSEESQLLVVALDVANRKLRTLSANVAEWVDFRLDVVLQTLYAEYRKEYVEFFVSFFSSGDELKDEVRLKLVDDYESLRDKLSVQNVVETTSSMESNCKVMVRLQNAVVFFPIYNSITETPGDHARVSTRLVDVAAKSACVVETGDVSFTNAQHEECPPGFTCLTIEGRPKVSFVEWLERWWQADRGGPGNVVTVLEPLPLHLLIKLKQKDFDFALPAQQVPEMAMQFKAGDATLRLNPLTYVHLLNVVEIFKRPLAQSGDAF